VPPLGSVLLGWLAACAQCLSLDAGRGLARSERRQLGALRILQVHGAVTTAAHMQFDNAKPAQRGAHNAAAAAAVAGMAGGA
jgi:hypothetical protein